MSSLFTVRENGNESYPPFEVLDTKGESKNTPHGVFLQGGVINSFNEMSTDYTCMDVETSPLQALSNQPWSTIDMEMTLFYLTSDKGQSGGI